MKTKDIDFNIVSEYVYYDSSSPSGLSWNKDIYAGINQFTRCSKGTQAGWVGRRTWMVKIKGSVYTSSRVIWKLVTKEDMVGKVIDHIDGDPLNNNISNLRCVDSVDNNRNKSFNKSGLPIGVCIVKDNAGFDVYRASWNTLDGKIKTKGFSVNKYGRELAEHLAKEYRLHQIDLLNIMGAGYTDRHGDLKEKSVNDD